jgi:formylglycine-generating enzyme required for sulfatase activity
MLLEDLRDLFGALESSAHPKASERDWLALLGLVDRLTGVELDYARHHLSQQRALWRAGLVGLPAAWFEARHLGQPLTEGAEGVLEALGWEGLPDWRGCPAVLVRAGSFVMGSPRGELGHDADEVQREVQITRPLWVDRVPITRQEWRALMPDDPSQFPGSGPEGPMERMSWCAVHAFANARSRRDGAQEVYALSEPYRGAGREFDCDSALRGLGVEGWRLPTEAEWEYFARAGTTTMTWLGDFDASRDELGDLPGGELPLLQRIAWGDHNSRATYPGAFEGRRGPQPVGLLEPNPWGLYDVFGNVMEWCQDAGSDTPPPERVDPLVEGPRGSTRVFRGGSWMGSPSELRAAHRAFNSTGGGGLLGARLVRPASQ